MSLQTIPKRVFIIPYRDRENNTKEFIKNMTALLENDNDTNTNTNTNTNYEFYFAHQCDNRPFNRGAMKNMGFLAIKNKYPANYKEITFIFHDVDTWPSAKGLIDYNTTNGVVKHYYGYKFALGGMFAIKGADFEKSRGFPNFWGWGIEDNTMNDRCSAAGLTIDRSCFYDINDMRIVRAFDGFSRVISRKDSLVYKHETPDDMNALKNIKWNIVLDINNTNPIFMINISNFDCIMNPREQIYQTIDIRKTKKIIVPKVYEFRRQWNMFQH